MPDRKHGICLNSQNSEVRSQGAPSTANTGKLDNPARPKSNQQVGTEPCAWGGNESCEALGKELSQPQRKWRYWAPKNDILHRAKGFWPWKPVSVRAQQVSSHRRAGV